MTIRSDVLAMATGFGSVRVKAGSVETRGLWDDAEREVEGALVRVRVLRLATAAVPDLDAEDTVYVGDLEDDTDLTSYRVMDRAVQNDGTETLIWVAS